MSVSLEDPRWLKLSARLNRGKIGVIVWRRIGLVAWAGNVTKVTAYFLPDACQTHGVLKEGGAYFDAISLLRALSRAMATVAPGYLIATRLAREQACDLMSELYEEAGGKNP